MNPLFATTQSAKVASLWDDDNTLADEGGYFVTTNPTPGTAIAMTTSVVDDAATASSTHAQFAPAMVIFNNASPADPNAPSLYMRYINLTIVQVPTSATNWKYAFRLDNLNRYLSGGSALTPVNTNPGSSRNSKANFYFGAIVPVALPSASSRLVANGTIETAIPTLGDSWLFGFGNRHVSASAAGSVIRPLNVSPIIIPPGWSLSMEMWGTSNAAAPSWEFECGHVERMSGL
jgi:hypothetical protein